MERLLNERLGGSAEWLLTAPARRKLPQFVEAAAGASVSASEAYWSHHTVRGKTFLSKAASLDYIRELTDGRPLKRELLKLHGPHPGRVIVDYGCGPGNDLAGFAEFSDAAKVIGVDVSAKALRLARTRCSWHVRDPQSIAFIRASDSHVRVPMTDASVDYIQSLGVIHHASDPHAIFLEFHRLLKPSGEARIMLYNANSVHVQLEVGHFWRHVYGVLVDKETPEAAFSAQADLGAPIAHCVRPVDVRCWLGDVGLELEFLGGYFMPKEAENWQERRDAALADERLSDVQRSFLEALKPGSGGLPFYQDKPAGLGGVYVLRKPVKQ
jgi:ubiquinone/menaquinone biosynthesis C-methylase UbiE